jgi:hypothetical protein
MDQIVELICTFRLRTLHANDGEVDQVMNFLLNPSTMPALRALILDPEDTTWSELKDEIGGERWRATYLKSLASSFDRRGVDLWLNQPHLRKESILVRDMMCKTN